MKINKLNYEAFAIDYIEGNLSEKSLRSMELFLNDHPNIKAEIEEMARYELPQFKNIVLIDKSSLLQSERKRLWPLLSIAATLILLIGFSLFLFISNQGDDLANELAINMNETSEEIELKKPNNLNGQQQIYDLEALNESVIKSESEKSVAELYQDPIKPTPEKSIEKRLNKTTNIENVNPVMITKDSPTKSLAQNKLVDSEKLKATDERNVVAVIEPVKHLRPITIIKDLGRFKLPSAGIKSSLDKTDLVDEVALLLNTEPIVAQINKRQKSRNLADYIQPESYDKSQLGSLKEALVPEAFANLFSKKSDKTR